MKEKLIIKNFGPIKEVDLDLGKFTVLIGEQATGKSTVAKVLAVCKYFSYVFQKAEVDIHYDIFRSGLTAWGLSEHLNDNTFIHYECEHYAYTYECFLISTSHQGIGEDEPKEYDVPHFAAELQPISTSFKKLKNEIDAFRSKSSAIEPLPIALRHEVEKIFDFRFYFPVERSLQSLFSLGQKSISNIPNFLYDYYSVVDLILRNFGTNIDVGPLDITYVNKNGIGFVKRKVDDTFFSLANAASGYQAIIPIVLVMKYYNEKQKRKKTFILEEPELNLFPSAQNQLMYYLAEQINAHSNTILLTTHSPYILASANNLIYAHKVGQKNKEEVNEIIVEKYWLDPVNVSAYRLEPTNEGTVSKNIIDTDLEEIRLEEIDEISKKINADYDKILDIKFKRA